ncbi:MAG: DUF1311 domain-containing protein, partial [Alphaproteobacteria bacterium]|nr:DUF1311 domain-containing protein [Alphaproteobacteria bacterium]
MHIRGLAVAILLGVGWCPTPIASAAPAASFDCAAARLPIEKLICQSDELSALDAAVGRAFAARHAGAAPADQPTVLEEQRAWLRGRLGRCNVPATGASPAGGSATSCLIDLYRDRLAALAPSLAATPTAGPSATVTPSGASATPATAPAAMQEAPAHGRQEFVFEVAAAGRYAVRVDSAAGVALQVIDRMAGPSAVSGEPGKTNGRLDLFLDRGSYKAVLLGPDNGEGRATLHVDAFRELSDAALPQLVELRPVDAELGDLEQRSWWLDVTERRPIAIEAAGRYLADLRIWRDGSWLVDATPAATRIDRDDGHPLALRQLATTLEPGLYRVTAYGGTGEIWANGGDAKPFHLRFGIPVLAGTGSFRRIASPFGVDRFVVQGPANHFRLQLDQPDTAAIAVNTYNATAPFPENGSRGEIAKNSRDPAATVNFAVGERSSGIVTIEREPGKPYVLQDYDGRRIQQFHGSGEHWIEAIHDPTSDGDPDLTGVLTETQQFGGERIVATSGITLAPGAAWRRRFNLLDTVTLHVSIEAPGDYRVNAEGDTAEAEFRFEPVGALPANYRRPVFETPEHVWTLEAGVYLLTIQPRPEHRGIATVTLRPADYTGDIAPAPRHGVVAFRTQPLSAASNYRLYFNEVPGIGTGIVLRERPVDLARDLPTTLAPGETVEVPVTVPAAGGTLTARGADDTPLPFALDGADAATSAAAAPGAHTIRLVNSGPQDLSLALHVEPPPAPETPLPPLSAERLQRLPNFPELTAAQPLFRDIARGEQQTVNIAVRGPALYQLQTSGLLATSGTLRTKLVTSLDREDGNGVGRNFLIQRYLREGDYQLSMMTRGQSQGHYGLALVATPIADRGLLTAGIPSRALLNPGEALRYDFRIDHRGHYVLRAFGMDRQFAVRLEDHDGWPVADPVFTGPIERDFEPGLYHVIVLPESVAARSIAELEEIVPPPERTGHGPHELAIGEQLTHEWLEPEPGGERVPDRWRFSLPGPSDVSLTIGEGMIATLVREAGADRPVVVPLFREPGWSGRLDAGDYVVEATSIRPNNHLDYTLSLATKELLVGQSRMVDVPATIPLSLGGNDLVEIASFGPSDVRARLYDSANRLVAANDDRENDWNFAISATLPAGSYRLLVDPVGTNKATTRVDLVQPAERQEPALAVPGSAALSDALLHTYPLSLPQGQGLLVVAAVSPDAISLSLERPDESGAWRTIGSAAGQSPFLALPLAAAPPNYRLRVWSTDHKPANATIVARLLTPAPASEARLAAGIALQAIDGITPPLAAAAVKPTQPGVLAVEGGGPEMMWSSREGLPVASDPSGLIVAGAEPFWLIGRAGSAADTVRASRIDFASETRLSLPPGDTTIVPPPATSGSGPVLWLARSRFGQPGLVAGDP